MKTYKQIALESRNIDYAPICERCNKQRSVDVDHIEGRKGELLLDEYNLIFLCRDCHVNKGGWKEKEKMKEIVRGIIIACEQ